MKKYYRLLREKFGNLAERMITTPPQHKETRLFVNLFIDDGSVKEQPHFEYVTIDGKRYFADPCSALRKKENFLLKRAAIHNSKKEVEEFICDSGGFYPKEVYVEHTADWICAHFSLN